MPLRLFPERPLRAASSRPPAGCVIWAVGGIHGRSDLADRLIQAIRADLHRSDAPCKVVIFLGDAIDHGLDSKGVLNQLSNLAADPGLEVRFVRGERETRMEAFLRDPGAGPDWCDDGGRATLASYGVMAPPPEADASAWAAASRALAEALPGSHHDILAAQEGAVTIGEQVFTHADAKALGLEADAPTTNVVSALRLQDDARMLMRATGRAGRVAITTTPAPV